MYNSSAARAKKKPAQHAGEYHCLICNRTAAEHGQGNECERFRPRPCTCGHPHALHDGACQDRGCECRQYREDATAEFLLRMGVRAGEWQFITTAQLQFLMRPQHDRTVRVWACGMLHSIGQRSRLAVKILPDGRRAPLSPSDIVAELNALDPIGRIDKQAVRMELRELEKQGAARQVGRLRNNVRLFFYAKPLRTRTLRPQPELVEAQSHTPCVENLVVKSDYQIPASASKESHLFFDQFSATRAALVKDFRRALRAELGAEADLVVKSDYQIAEQQAVEAVLLVVKSNYQRLHLVVRSGRAYKEDSIYSSSRQAGALHTEREPEPEPMPASPPASPSVRQDEPDPDPLLIGLVERGFAHADPELVRSHLGQATVEDFFGVLDERLRRAVRKREPIGVGLLPSIAQEADRARRRIQTVMRARRGSPIQ